MKCLGNPGSRTVASKILIAASTALFTFLVAEASAKSGVIVKGENGTKWCCVDGQKGDSCVKGSSSTPAGSACNFAERAAPGTPIGGVIVKGGKNPGGQM